MRSALLMAYLSTYYDEVTPREFYREIFPVGSLEKRGEYVQGKYTAIAVAVTNERKPDGRVKVLRHTITDDLDVVEELANTDNFCLCSPIGYAGKRRTAENARELYAIAVDLDYLKVRNDLSPLGVENLLERHVDLVERIPRPTFIVGSGSGIHLYYVLDTPVKLYRDVVRSLQEYKRELTRLIWHDTITDIQSTADIQQEGIYQGFRMPGTITKSGGRARAFRIGERVSLEYLNSFVADRYKMDISQTARKASISLQEAAELYPEWYERRIVRGEGRGFWGLNRAVYDWWLDRIKSGATVGHRYYCVMTLAVYARKCSRYDPKHNPNPVTREELERDCFSLVEAFDAMTKTADNHFSTDDVLSALEAFDDRWITFTRRSIADRSGIQITANKRNGQRQRDHLEEARAIRDIRARRRGEKWDAHNGRKSKGDLVAGWRMQNPDGSKAECIKQTGLSKPTVYKYWNENDVKKNI